MSSGTDPLRAADAPAVVGDAEGTSAPPHYHHVRQAMGYARSLGLQHMSETAACPNVLHQALSLAVRCVETATLGT